VKQAFHACRIRATAFAREEDGPSATEYAILLAMIVLGTMGVIQSIGEDFHNIYMVIANSLPNA
jgi:Flp pilus assembly pilin Flp